MFPFLIPLIGAGLGAIANKKDPLKGALMGGAMGFGGAALAPGLLGAGAAAGATGAAATGAAGAAGGSALAPGFFASEGLGAAAGASGATGASPGLFGSAATYAKQAEPIMKAAMMGNSLLGGGQQQQIGASPIMQNGGQGANALSQVYQQGNQYQQLLSNAQAGRMQRRMDWGRNG